MHKPEGEPFTPGRFKERAEEVLRKTSADEPDGRPRHVHHPCFDPRDALELLGGAPKAHRVVVSEDAEDAMAATAGRKKLLQGRQRRRFVPGLGHAVPGEANQVHRP
jgi:hypothetical protein